MKRKSVGQTIKELASKINWQPTTPEDREQARVLHVSREGITISCGWCRKSINVTHACEEITYCSRECAQSAIEDMQTLGSHETIH